MNMATITYKIQETVIYMRGPSKLKHTWISRIISASPSDTRAVAILLPY